MRLDIFQKKVSKPTKSIKKWSNKTQALFLTQVGELLEEGFTLQETLAFAKLLIPKQEHVISKMMEQLLMKTVQGILDMRLVHHHQIHQMNLLIIEKIQVLEMHQFINHV